MRRAWKIALPVACAALIGSAMTFELVHRHQLEQQKLALQAQAYRVRAEQGDALVVADLLEDVGGIGHGSPSEKSPHAPGSREDSIGCGE